MRTILSFIPPPENAEKNAPIPFSEKLLEPVPNPEELLEPLELFLLFFQINFFLLCPE